MEKINVQIALEKVAAAREALGKAQTQINADVEQVMARLLHEASRHFMSAEEVARLSGLTTKRVRTLMRSHGLDPQLGKRMLSKRASEALTENAALMGIDPAEMDLMSPLAYLPMGGELRAKINAEAVSSVTEDSYETAKERILEALLLGRDAGEVPIVLADTTLSHIAAWLASEGVA